MNSKILKHPILQKYNEKELENLLIHFVKFVELAQEKENKEEKITLHQIYYKDMNKKEQNAYNKYKNYSVEDFKKAGFVNF